VQNEAFLQFTYGKILIKINVIRLKPTIKKKDIRKEIMQKGTKKLGKISSRKTKIHGFVYSRKLLPQRIR
jgi:hypothetical protein